MSAKGEFPKTRPPAWRHDIPPTQAAQGFRGRRLGTLMHRVVGPVLRRRGFRAINIIEHWPTIVGPQLAALSCPERISRRGGAGAVLQVRVEGAMALEVQHLEPLIVERLNRHFGAGSIDRLKIVQGPVPMGRPKSGGRLPNPAEMQAAHENLGDFPEGPLKQALARLGAHMLRDEPPQD